MKSISIDGRLRLLVLVTALPLVALSAGIAIWQNHTEGEFLRQDSVRTAGVAMQAVDRELSRAIAGLQVLAASPAVAQRDFKALHAQARAAVGIAGNSVIILYDRAGNRILSTAVDFGEPLERRADMSLLAPPFDTGMPHVTQLFTSETRRQPTVGVVVPVSVEGQVRYVLGAGLLSRNLSGLLAGSGVPDGWVAALVDQQGTIIARTRSADQFVGQKALPDVWQRLQAVKGLSGTVEGNIKEGDAAELSFARSGASPWTAVVAVPSALLAGGLRNSLLLLGAASMLVMLLCLVLASRASRLISKPATQLLDLARALEQGKELRPFASGVAQFDGLAAAMHHAGHITLDRERRLRESLGQLRIANEQLRQEQSKKDQFIATLAHELRNPMAPIRTGVQILARSPPAPLAARTVALMERQIAHITRLLDDLLDVSRIVRGRLLLQTQDADLADVISLAGETVEPLLKAADQRLTLNAPREPVVVKADSPRLTQVLTNVLNNAIKFSPKGDTITVDWHADGDEVEILVSDTGIGIPADKLEEVFDSFTQVKDEQQGAHPGGLGIGLSLARALMRLHGGSIQARSQGPGRGTTIVLRLPGSAVGGTTAAGSDAVVPLRATSAGPALRLLVVDDNRDAADTLATALRMSGHSVHVAYDGMKALDHAAEADLDAVVLDIGMPELDGYEVCRRLRQEPRNAGLKIIALTGWGAEADRQRTRDAGFDAHLTKPVDCDTLEQTLGATVEKKQA